MTPQDFVVTRELNRNSNLDQSPMFSGLSDTPNGARITATIPVTGTGDIATTQDFIAQSMSNDGWQLLSGVQGQFTGNNFAFTVTTKAGVIPTALNVDTVKAQVSDTFNRLGLPLSNVSVELTYADSNAISNQNITSQATSFLSSIGSYFGFDKPTSTLGGLGITAAAGGVVVILTVLFLTKD